MYFNFGGNEHNQTTNQNTVSLRSRRTHADPVAEALLARGEDNRHLVEPKNRGERQTGLVGGIAMPHLWSASRRAQRGSREAAWGGAQWEQGGRGDAVLEAVERAAAEEAVEAGPSG